MLTMACPEANNIRIHMSIIRAQQPDSGQHVPLTIIGGGACGMSAALAASDAGVECVVIEQDAQPSGSTGMSYGAICAAGSRIQSEAGIEDSAAAMFEDILAITRNQTDPELARLLANESGPTIDWLSQKHAIHLTLEAAWTGLGHRQPRLHAPVNRSGATLMAMLAEACDTAGCPILTEARVDALFADAHDVVTGVRMNRPDGSIEDIHTTAVVIATCGFGANRDWVQRHMPEISDARYFGHEGNRGDGIAWGQALGGEVKDMGAYQALGSLAEPQAVVIPHILLIAGGIQVNRDGRRFEDELTDISGQALTILKQPDQCCWIIYDEPAHEDALSRFEEYRLAVEMRVPKSAASLRELASSIGLPPDALVDTVDELAKYRAGTLRDPFGRQFQPDQQLRAPYFAIRVTGALFHTQGGLSVDANAAVIRADGTPLPNLYAGGGAARSVSGPGCWGYLPGMGLCTAVTLGRIAGESAARDIRGRRSGA